MHEHNVVYYDLKSPNILVFKFPSAQESLQATAGALDDGQPTPRECAGIVVLVVIVKDTRYITCNVSFVCQFM